MAKQAEPTHRRIPYRVRVRLKALGRLCAHSSASVAAAAHKEIGAIHRKYLLGRASRMRAWFGNLGRAGVRKVTPHQLHKPLRINAAPAKAPKRGQPTPIRAQMPKNGFTPLTDHTLTRAELRQRAKADRQARRNGQPVPQAARPQAARKPDAMAQAQAAMRGDRQQGPLHGPVRDLYSPQSVLSADDRQARERERQAAKLPPLPGHPEAVRKAAEDRDKKRWTGLDKHRADAPPRVRTGRFRAARSRSRTSA